MPDESYEDFASADGSEGGSHPPPIIGGDPFKEQHELARHAQQALKQQQQKKLINGHDATIPDI